LAGVFHVQRGQQKGKSDSRLHSMKLKELATAIAEPVTALLLVWFFSPIIIALILSFAVSPLFVSRYLIGVIPVFSLLAARGINNIGSLLNARNIRTNITALALISLVVLITLAGLYDYYSQTQKDQWREAIGCIEESAQPEDAVMFAKPYFRYPFDYYYKGSHDIQIVPQEAVEDAELLEGVERLWLVVRSFESTKDESLSQALVERYGRNSLILKENFYGITVYLFDTNAEDNNTG